MKNIIKSKFKRLNIKKLLECLGSGLLSSGLILLLGGYNYGIYLCLIGGVFLGFRLSLTS